MNLLYNLGIRILVLAIRLASFSKPKAKKWIEGRKGLMKKIKNDLHDVQNVVWIHCASLGEFEQGRPLIEEIKLRFPQKKILLTFYSPSGYEVQKDYPKADFVYYMPADTARNARRFIHYVKPEAAFFIKYEYWYNYLRLLHKNAIPSYFVSAIFRKDQLFFKKRGGWYRKMLKYPTHFFVQNEETAKLLKSLGKENFTIAGDTRFDRVAHILENVKPIKLVESFVGGSDVMVAGSSWKAEEAIIHQYIRNRSNLKIILVPHVIEAENIQRILNLYGSRAILFSEATPKNVSDKQVLIVDNYGMLTSLYQYGKIAFIGGGFGVGIHNVLEAAIFGMPILFGPNHEKFAEAVDLVNQNCAFPVHNIEDFNTIVNYLLNDSRVVFSIAEKAAEYVRKNVGATRIILDQVF
ncbi:MAG: 3-deoxy-D-manno-octulosonic acid transferase [Prolixibacteraceae bacterium]|nr:3-deoxy-D-manno-octulosonic acid transferase [Prolixibacteraceae bacterium]